MKKTSLAIMSVCSVLFCVMFYAFADSSTGGYYGISSVRSGYSGGFHGLTVNLSGITETNVAPTPCPSTDGYSFDSSNGAYEEMAAEVMAAFLTGKTVQFWISTAVGTSNACTFSRPRVTEVDVQN